MNHDAEGVPVSDILIYIYIYNIYTIYLVRFCSFLFMFSKFALRARRVCSFFFHTKNNSVESLLFDGISCRGNESDFDISAKI